MSASNDTNRIETDDLLIELNSNNQIEIHNLLTGESVTIGSNGVSASGLSVSANGYTAEQRGAPTTAELAVGERMQYVSDGSDGNAAGDLVSARNNAGTIVSQVIAAAANDA